MSDLEFELIKRRKLLEMKKRLEKKPETGKNEDSQKIQPKDLLARFFIGRAWEVFNAARLQYPQAAEEVEKTLVKLIAEGRIKSKITGEELYGLFYRLGLRIKLETRINILEHGELKSLEQKMRERTLS